MFTSTTSTSTTRPGRVWRQRAAVSAAAIALLGTTAVLAGAGSETASAARVADGATTRATTSVDYGGTTGWTLVRNVDLTKEPAGTTYTTGVRTSTDQSYNRRQQATYDANGLTVTAQRTSGKIYSADVQLRGVDVPSVGAVEVDVNMQGVGPGLGHAVWFRPLTGSSGEMDLLEYIGANAGKGISGGPGKYESKSTLIRTGSSPYNLGSKAFGIPARDNGSYEGLRHYRYEFTKTSVSLWVDGVRAGTITKDAFEKQNGAGSWSQFASSTHWYPRVTLQVNNGTSAKLWGTVPSTWQQSTIRVKALRIYKKS